MRIAVFFLACFLFIPLSGKGKWERLSGKFEKHYARPDFESALEDAFKSLEYAGENFDSTDQRLALSNYYVAKGYEAMGDAEKARAYVKKAYALLRLNLAYDDNMVQVSRLYGKIETELGYHKSAGILLSSALESSLELFGQESGPYLQTLYAMADLEMAMAHWEDFIGLLTDALQIHERNFPLDDDYTMYANYLGLLYLNSEAFSEAILYFNKALMAYGKGGLKENLGCANANNNLGLIHYYKAEYENAALHFDRAGEIYRKLTEVYSENYMMLLSNQAFLYFSWEKEEMLEVSFRVLGDYLDLHAGRVDLPYIQGLENMANFYAESGSFEDSEVFFLRAIKARESMDPVDQEGLRRCILSLISVCEEFSMSDKAAYYKEMAQE